MLELISVYLKCVCLCKGMQVRGRGGGGFNWKDAGERKWECLPTDGLSVVGLWFVRCPPLLSPAGFPHTGLFLAKNITSSLLQHNHFPLNIHCHSFAHRALLSLLLFLSFLLHLMLHYALHKSPVPKYIGVI